MRRSGLDSLEGWFTASVCCLIFLLMYGCAGLSSLLYVAAVSRFKTDRNQASYPFIVCNVMQAATGPFVGYFTKKYSGRTIVLIGSILGFVGIGTCFFAETIVEITVLWGVLFGAGFGFSTLLLPAIINDYFAKHKSKAMGLIFLGSPLGYLTFPPIFEVLLSQYGLSGTFLFLAGMNMHCMPLSLFLRKPDFKGDSPEIPLNDSKNTVSYSGLNSLTLNPNLSKENIAEKNIRSQINPSLRRFSFEFLWNASSWPTNLTNKVNKQYVLNLNKSDFGTMSERESVRSYETIKTNIYKNTSISKRNEFSRLDYPCVDGKGNTSCILKANTNRNFKDNEICPNHKPKTHTIFHKKESFNESNFQIKNVKKITQVCNEMNETGNSQDMNKFNNKYLCSYEQFSAIYYGKSNTECKTHTSLTDNLTKESLRSSHQDHSSLEFNDIYHTSGPSARDLGKSYISNPSKTSNKNGSYTENDSIGSCRKGSIFDVYFSAIFILMSVANAIFNLQFITITTVIIDFSRDHGIESSYEKFIMMCISIMGAIGMLGFGWVTDGGFMTRNRFGSLCMLVGGACLAVLPMTFNIVTLMTVVAFWCVSQSSFAPLTPSILAEYVDKDDQAIAVSAYNLLCAPLYFIIPLLIGYFRDGKGSYAYIFYLLSGLSLLNSVILFIIPWVTKPHNTKSG